MFIKLLTYFELLKLVTGLMTISTQLIQSTSYQKCLTHQNTVGYCSPASQCGAATGQSTSPNCCVLNNRNVGVCCGQSSGLGSLIGPPVWWNPAGVLPGIGPEPGPTTQPTTTKAPPTTTRRPDPPRQDVPKSGCGVTSKKDFTRIQGGRPADPGQWPWMVAIMRGQNLQFCGGSLITEQHVLTAAHCLYKYKPCEVWVRLGEHDFSRGDETRSIDVRVIKFRIHQNFDEITYENDIAIMDLQRPVRFNTYIWPVCLPDMGTHLENASAIVAGWGTIEFGGPASNVLLEVSVDIWQNAKCENEYVQPILDTNLCAGGVKGQDSCQGDSGGPLLVQLPSKRWMTVGVVSWGIKCGEARPAVYTRVSKFLHWILNHSIFG